MPLDVLQTLRELIAIPSVNPMGRDVSGPEYLETRLTEHLERLFDRLGLRHHRQAVAPGQDNILCRIEGRSDRLLLLEAHQDTVPVDGMTIPPFEPNVSEGRVYGRGACDVKGGMAAMLAAVARLAEERPPEMPTVVLACTINEEFGFSGATRLVESWQAGDPLLPRRPDAAIVAEPTLLNVVVAHKGTVRWKCHARGLAGHSSQPQRAQNAIYAAGRAALAVEHYQNEVLENHDAHPLCGRPTACATMIAAGVGVNTIPDHCRLEIERRLLPDEDPDAAYQETLDHIARRLSPDDQVEHEPPYVRSLGLSDRHNGRLAEQLRRAALPFAPDCASIGVPYGTDAAVYAAAGVPTVVFGPGSIDQAHRADEWLAVDQLEKASETLYRFGRQA
jgi:acetylornithine deacetylase